MTPQPGIGSTSASDTITGDTNRAAHTAHNESETLMRSTRILALTATTVLTLGLAACGSSSSSDSSSASTPTAAADSTKGDETGASGDFCDAAEKAFANFDPASMSAGDPESVHTMADAFRQVADAADGETAEAWSSYADMLDASADAIEDPSKATELANLAQDANTWLTTITESVTSCAS
jgi:hypothetical protein